MLIILILCLNIIVSANDVNEIHYKSDTGLTELFSRIIKPDNFYIWDISLTDFNDNPAWNDANIPMIERDPNYHPGDYYASFPISIPKGCYYIEIYEGLPPSKTSDWVLTWESYWDGNKFISLENVWEDTNEIETKLPSGFISGSTIQEDPFIYYHINHLFKDPISDVNKPGIEIIAGTIGAMWMAGYDSNNYDFSVNSWLNIYDEVMLND